MKKIVVIMMMLLVGVATQAQKKNKNAKIAFDADGVCRMCKKRIEKACLQTKGVKFANWNVDTHQLLLIIDERKTSKKAMQQVVANVGHDTKAFKAPQDVYDNLHDCCKYRDEEIRGQHKKK